MSTDLPTEWTKNSGPNKRPLAKGMLVRMASPPTWKMKMYAVARAGAGDAGLVQVTEGGWSDSGSIPISLMAEVEYRKDEGAPYNEDKYGNGPAVVSVPWQATKEEEETGNKDTTNNEVVDVEPERKEQMATNDETVRTRTRRVSPPPVAPAAAPAKRGRKPKAVAAAETEAAAAANDQGGGKVMRTSKQPKNPLSARVTPKRRVSRPQAAQATEGGSETWYTLAETAEAAGVIPTRVNALRKAGLLPKRGAWKKEGRAVLYSQRGVDAIKKLQEKGVRIPASGSAAAVAPTNGKRRGRPPGSAGRKAVAARGGNVNGVVGVLTQAIADAEAQAAKYSRLAESLRQSLEAIQE